MSYYKFAFYVEAETLEEAEIKLAERIDNGDNHDSDQEVTQSEFEEFV